MAQAIQVMQAMRADDEVGPTIAAVGPIGRYSYVRSR